MPSKDAGEDIAFFLYLVPLVAAIAYGVYEWVVIGPTSSTMPGLAYLIVSKSEYLFILALAAVCIGIIAETRAADSSQRESIVQANTFRLQILAIVVLIISFAAALSVSDYNLGGAAVLFIAGRYPLIFAFFLIGMSLLLSAKQFMGNAKLSSLPEIIGLILLVLSPVIFYGSLKVHISYAASSVAALILAIIGLVFLSGGSRMFLKRQTKPAQATQAS